MARLLPAMLVLAGLLTLSSAAWAARADDPRACVQAIATAVDEADTRTFARRIDLDGITWQVFTRLSSMAEDPAKSAWMPPVLALLAGKGLLTGSLSRNYLVGEVRNFVLYGVGSGAFAGRKVKGFESDSMLAPVFGMASMGRKEIRDIGQPSRLEGRKMLVPFSVHDHDNGNTYRVEGEFSPASDGYRMTGIRNLDALIMRIGREAEEGGYNEEPLPAGAVQL